MLRKVLLTTSALVIAGSVALADPHGTLRSGPTLASLLQQHRDALKRKGMILDRKGVPIAVERWPSLAPGRTGAHGESAPSSLFEKHDSYSNFGKKNALFLFWFGWFAGNASTHSAFSGSYCYSYNSSHTQCINHYKYKESFSDVIHQSAAQPFTGLKAASSISIAVAQYSGTGPAARVGLYSNHGVTASCPSSCPGSPIVGASGTFNATGDVVTVKFSLVSLKKKSRYWVVLNGVGTDGRVAWLGENSNFTASEFSGEDYKYSLHEKIHESYGTTAHTYYCGGHCTYKTTINESSNGWIHTAAYGPGEWPGAFSINQPPP
jgi:hypothetical protein